MHTQLFTPAQGAHALEVVLELMKRRRFFLYRPDQRPAHGELVYELNPAVFGPALRLDDDIRRVYARTKRLAGLLIAEEERELDVSAPELGNRQLVQCNCFTGGLDICQVYPLTTFLELAPLSPIALETRLSEALRRKSTEECSPKELALFEEQVRKSAHLVWNDIDALRMQEEEACVVLLKSRFSPSDGHTHDDFMEGKLSNIPLRPHGLGYLLYEFSKRERLVRHNFIAFNGSRRAHVEIQHWQDSEPSLQFNATDGYDCTIFFAVAM